MLDYLQACLCVRFLFFSRVLSFALQIKKKNINVSGIPNNRVLLKKTELKKN